jgi:hypothetical protein
MKFPCTLKESAGGQWTARHESDAVGAVNVVAASRALVLDKMRGELRYRLELCPCTGESYRHIDVEIVEETGK